MVESSETSSSTSSSGESPHGSSSGAGESTVADTGGVDTIDPDTSDPNTSDPDTGDTNTSGGVCLARTYFPDFDGDGYGHPDYGIVLCEPMPGLVEVGGDCDDDDPSRSPGVDEECNAVDDDCDGLVDEASAINVECSNCRLGMRNGHAYYYCLDDVSWDDARWLCEQFSADLVEIEDEDEYSFLLTEPIPDTSSWIGMSDTVTEGVFSWPDGALAPFTAWGEGQPDDALGAEDCVELVRPSNMMNDLPCGVLLTFICEATEHDL